FQAEDGIRDRNVLEFRRVLCRSGIKTLREIGFDTFKLNGCEELGLIDNSRAVDAAVNTVAQIREAFGNQIEFGLDFHGRVSAPKIGRASCRERTERTGAGEAGSE